MLYEQSLAKARYYSSVVLLYVATLLFAIYLFKPTLLIKSRATTVALENVPAAPQTNQPTVSVVMGRPVRMVIESLGMDKLVVEGYFNSADGSWTLSPDTPHFAMPSTLANNYEGNTIIYGHNTDRVFASLDNLQPGDRLRIYTNNGRILTYLFEAKQDVLPNDVSAFHYSGSPIVTLQTCEGPLDEWRRMFRFNFHEVVL